jgi:hypothetical protein
VGEPLVDLGNQIAHSEGPHGCDRGGGQPPGDRLVAPDELSHELGLQPPLQLRHCRVVLEPLAAVEVPNGRRVQVMDHRHGQEEVPPVDRSGARQGGQPPPPVAQRRLQAREEWVQVRSR